MFEGPRLHDRSTRRAARATVMAMVVVAATIGASPVAADWTRPSPAVVGTGLAASGGLDGTFGIDGKVVSPIGTAGVSVALQADGKIVVAGSADPSAFQLARYKADGTPDSTFDGDGRVTTSFGGVFETASAVVIQANGKIVAGGEVSPGGFCCQFALARYNSNGSLDTTFDGDGITTTNFGGSGRIVALALQGDGKLIAAGTIFDGLSGGLAVARYNSNGTLDATFGTGGHVIIGGAGSTASGVALQADGKIVAAGSSPNLDFVLARLTTAGIPDAGFGTSGLAVADFGGNDAGNALAIQADGKIVVVGRADQGFAVARFASDGMLDSTFDGDGKKVTRFFGLTEYANGVAIQQDGKIVVVGRTLHDYNSSFAIARYDSDGWLDGRQTTDFGDPADLGVLCPPARTDCSEDIAYAVAIQGDGKIVAVGGGGPCGAPCKWTLARYTSIAPIKELTASPTTVDLGSIVAGSTPGSATVTITNTGSTGVTIDTVGLTTAHPEAYSITSQGCPLGGLAARASCDIDVQFAPTTSGVMTADLTVQSDAPLSTLTVPLSGTGTQPASGVTWGSTRHAGPAYTWNTSDAMARTVSSSGQKLHVAYATDRIGSSWAKNAGPYMGIYYVRSSSGSTWTTAKRLNPSKQHAWRMGMAAAGSRVYVAWASQTRVTKFDPKAPRVLYVRVNTKHGASTSWRSSVRLTSTSGRVDFPTVAASGTDAYVAYTDSVTGSVRLAVSHDRGVTWAKKTIGSTVWSSTQGRTGLPYVAASGSNIVVAWQTDASGTVVARTSADRGSTWAPPVTITGEAIGSASASAYGARAAVAWTTGTEIHLRTFDGTDWGADTLVSGIASDAQLAYSPSVVLRGSSRVGVAWSEQVEGDLGFGRLKWAESADGGALWFETQTLADDSSAWRHLANDWPSVLWPSDSVRQVLWNGWTHNTNNYRLYLRIGTGAPVGPAAAAVDVAVPETPIVEGDSTGGLERGRLEPAARRGSPDR